MCPPKSSAVFSLSGPNMASSMHPWWTCGSACSRNPWAPPGHHQGTNMPVLCVCHQFCCRRWQTCERAWCSRMELSKLATSLVFVEWWGEKKNGSLAEATTKTQEGCRQAPRLRDESLLNIITSRKYFQFYRRSLLSELTWHLRGLIIPHNCVIISHW